MSARYSVAVVCTLGELEELEDTWLQLWRSCPSATPFQLPGWLIPWWRAFAPGELQVACVRRDERLVGLAPLYLEALHDTRRLLPMGISSSDYLDILIDPQYGAAACAVLADHLREMSIDWACCELTELAPHAAARGLPTPFGLDEHVAPCSVCPVIAFPSGASDLKQVLPAHRLRAVRYSRNRAKRLGTLAVTQATTGSSGEYLAILDELHGERRRSCGSCGVLADRRVYEFLKDAVPRLMANDNARIYSLRLSDRCVAAYLVLVQCERMLAYLTGFDVRYERISPGAILLSHVIEQALREGMREFHFLRGAEPYKYLWGARPRRNLRRVFSVPASGTSA